MLRALPFLLMLTPAFAATPAPAFLKSIKHPSHLLGSMQTLAGDQNPYAVIVAPVTSGKITKGDVLVDNFNDKTNLQGTGTSIVSYSPTTKGTTVFAQLPKQLGGCPGGVGLSTAMTMLKSGWVIVGSAPSTDGTTATKGAGCLIVLDNEGNVATTFTSPNINDPWGNMAVVDNGTSASLFFSNSGFDVGAPTDSSPVLNKATILRMDLSIPAGKVPSVTKETVVASGFGEQADKGVFLIGPTGLALGSDGTLYVSDAVENRIVAIPSATTRTDSAKTGREITKANLLNRPLALVMAPNNHLLTVNGLNGQAVEVDPATGAQLGALWINNDKAQTPPGSGDLFGLAIKPDGQGFYFVQDDNNTLAEATF